MHRRLFITDAGVELTSSPHQAVSKHSPATARQKRTSAALFEGKFESREKIRTTSLAHARSIVNDLANGERAPSITPLRRCAADGTYEGSYFVFHRGRVNLSGKESETAFPAPSDRRSLICLADADAACVRAQLPRTRDAA